MIGAEAFIGKPICVLPEESLVEYIPSLPSADCIAGLCLWTKRGHFVRRFRLFQLNPILGCGYFMVALSDKGKFKGLCLTIPVRQFYSLLESKAGIRSAEDSSRDILPKRYCSECRQLKRYDAFCRQDKGEIAPLHGTLVCGQCRKLMRSKVALLDGNIRRAREVSAAGSHTELEWSALCVFYEWKCLRCNKQVALTKDHICPLSRGGGNSIDNIQPLCRSCNSRKGTRTINFRDHTREKTSKVLSLLAVSSEPV